MDNELALMELTSWRQDDTGILITTKKIPKSNGVELTDAGVAI